MPRPHRRVLMLERKVGEDDEEGLFMTGDDNVLLWTQDAEVQDVEDGGGEEGEAEIYSNLAKNFYTICGSLQTYKNQSALKL